jgi:hypothetical protein
MRLYIHSAVVVSGRDNLGILDIWPMGPIKGTYIPPLFWTPWLPAEVYLQ